jgi:hypothetical protein
MDYGLLVLLVILLSMLSALFIVIVKVDKATSRNELMTDDEIIHLFVKNSVIITIGSSIFVGIFLFIRYLLN